MKILHSWSGSRALATVAAVAALGAAGCGGGGGESVASAKTKFIDSCHKGHENDAADLQQCRCFVSQLEQKKHYKTAAQFDKVRKTVESGSAPPDLVAIAPSCQK